MPQCQFLFSAVFGFRNLTKEIFSELDDSKAEVPIFHVPMQWTWREVKMGCREPTPCLGVGPGLAAPRWRVGPPGLCRLCPFAHIFSISGKP